MARHRSIGERMARAKTIAARREAATDWAINWQDDHDATLRDLEKAVASRDWNAAARATGQLKAIAEKRFPALHRVIEALSDEDIA